MTTTEREKKCTACLKLILHTVQQLLLVVVFNLADCSLLFDSYNYSSPEFKGQNHCAIILRLRDAIA